MRRLCYCHDGTVVPAPPTPAPTPAPMPAPFPKCHPNSGVVELESGQDVKIADIVPGDRIRTPLGYEYVIGVPHRVDTELQQYIQITSSDYSTRLTGSHFIFANGIETRAKDVKVGDVITTTVGDQPVDGVQVVFDHGLNAILTWSGSYYIDGIKTSTNVDVGVWHWIPNFVRYLYGIRYYIFGIPYVPVAQSMIDVSMSWEQSMVERLMWCGAPQFVLDIFRSLVACFIALHEPVNAFAQYHTTAIVTLVLGVIGMVTSKRAICGH